MATPGERNPVRHPSVADAAIPLGALALSYPPFAFFNFASPALSVLYGITGFKIVARENVSEPGSQPGGIP